MTEADAFAVKVGSKAPEFTLPTVAGTPLSLSDLLGRKVAMYVWASW